jgi:hypothetical protein
VVLEVSVEREPDGVVGVGGETGAADVAVGELWSQLTTRQQARCKTTHVGEDLDGGVNRAEARGVKGLHVEDIDTLDLTEELETLDTGGLLVAVMSAFVRESIRGFAIDDRLRAAPIPK